MRKKLLLFSLVWSVLCLSVEGQTVLINPSGDGGFENGGTFAANGWTLENGSVTNQWFIGTVPPGFNNNVAFVSDDGGTSWSYTNTDVSVVHFYRDITFPAGETSINLSFNWQALGEAGSWDALMVSIAPTSYTPVANNTSLATGPLPAPAITLQQFWNVMAPQSAALTLPPSLIGNCSAPATWRLIFTWKNDGSLGTPPPIAIDNISLTSAAPPAVMPSPAMSPFTINNTLPTGGTNFNSFTDAVNWLNNVSGGCPLPNSIVFNVSAGQTFVEDVPEINATGDATNTITFQRAGAGANPVVQKASPGTIASSTALGVHGDAIMVLNGGDFITFDGIDLATDPAFSGVGLIEYGYYLKKASGSDACKNIVIKNCSITLNKAAIYSFGIFVSNISGTAAVTVVSEGGRSENIKIFNNTISNAYGGIQLRGFAAVAPFNFYDQNIEIGEDGGNTISNYGGSASIAYGIYTIFQNNCKINNNTISGGNGTTGAQYAIFVTTSNNGNYQINDNTISMVNNSTTGLVSGIYTTIGTTGNTNNTVEIDGNTITNIQRPGVTSGLTYFIYSTANGPNMWKVTNNIIGDSDIPSTGLIYGISQISTPATALIDGNIIRNITRSSTTSTSGFYGINMTGSATALNSIISNNEIFGLTGLGSSGIVGGINLGTNLTTNIFNNKIYDIVSENASGVVNGITVPSGPVTANIYNNLIGELRTPLSGNSTAINPNLRGINITSLTANSVLNVSHNTIYLSATSSGTNFGSAGIFHTVSATPTTARLVMRNNIVINNSTSNGTGRTVAYQRSGIAQNNYDLASNNNLLYAGVPGPNNLIFTDGTNLDQQLSDFQCRVAPREDLSVTENTAFLSLAGSNANFLHIDPAVPTRAESGATPIAGISEDFDGDIRQGNAGYMGSGSAPDIGADEGNFMLIDAVGPNITYDLLQGSVCLTPPTLSAVITDASGVNVAAGTKPRIWFKKSTEDNVLPATNTSADNGWKWVEASNASSPFTFTPDYSLLTSPVTNGEVIEYFVVAQDNSSPANVSAKLAAFNNCGKPTSVALAAALFPVSNVNSYAILNLPASVSASAAPPQVCISEDVTLSLVPSLPGAEYQWESSPVGANMWTPIAGATTQTYVVSGLSVSTDFRCVITCGGVPIAISPSSVVSVTVSTPEILTVTPGEACGPGPVSVTLGATANAGSDINWYEMPVGGSSIASGGTFTTPPLTMTTTYYVSASQGGGTESAAKPTYTTTANTFGNQWGLVFDVVNTDIVINSVDVYSVGTGGSMDVELRDNTGTLLQTVGPFTYPPGSVTDPVTVTFPLNLAVPVGVGYRLVSANMSGALIRETSGNTYPYISPSGNVVVTSGFITNPGSATYYWFYNWQVSTDCETPRVPVTASIRNEVAECPDDFSVCLDTPPFALTGGSPADGEYSGNGVDDDGFFDPAEAGLGVSTITFTFCATSCTFDITVGQASPEIEISEASGVEPNDGIICVGASATLTATGGLSYAWSTGENTASITVSPLVTTTYTVTATDGLGCTGTATVQIVVNPLPIATITPANASICLDDAQDLTASGGIDYLWSTGENTSVITVSPAATTTYFVTVTDVNSCQSTASATVTILSSPVVSGVLTQPTTCVSTDGAIALTISGAMGPYAFEWSTPNGSGLTPGQQNQSGLTVGTYFVTVTAGNGCTSAESFTLIGPGNCDACPTMGALTAMPSPVCLGNDVELTVINLTSMNPTYGIIFKYFPAPVSDPYSGGTVIATIPNSGLGGGGTTATTTTSFGTAGTYQIYAILTPTP
ncbi:MAG: beta strand repeat-containing protein, partial [Saprospiraceae bacterium]